jgi:16S rRNA (uracil1498-N3)-methyltransferase
MSERRFLVQSADIDAARGEARVTGPEHHHLTRVLRLRVGDAVALFDGEGGGHHGEVAAIGRDETRVRLIGPDTRPVDPEFSLTLAQGIPHSDRMEWVIQKGTELGVARVIPVVAARSVVRPPRGRWDRLERWRRVAQAASRQSGRRRVPVVEEPRGWDEVLASLPEAGERLMLCEDPASASTQRLSLPPGARHALVAVGPEGGWSGDEVAAGLRAGLRPIHLGPRILRTETAGVAAVALLMFLAGEMNPR